MSLNPPTVSHLLLAWQFVHTELHGVSFLSKQKIQKYVNTIPVLIRCQLSVKQCNE